MDGIVRHPFRRLMSRLGERISFQRKQCAREVTARRTVLLVPIIIVHLQGRVAKNGAEKKTYLTSTHSLHGMAGSQLLIPSPKAFNGISYSRLTLLPAFHTGYSLLNKSVF